MAAVVAVEVVVCSLEECPNCQVRHQQEQHQDLDQDLLDLDVCTIIF